MKRWLLWNLRCHRGRDCANLMIEPVEGQDAPPDDLTIVAEYECGGCHTIYRTECVETPDGFTQFSRVRVKRFTRA